MKKRKGRQIGRREEESKEEEYRIHGSINERCDIPYKEKQA